MSNFQEYLTKLYYDPSHPASYTGLNKLHRIVKKEGLYDITRAQLKQWLRKQETYTLHRSSRRKGPKLRVISPYPDYMWDADLADLSSLSKFNKGFHFFLLIVDIFSRFVWTRPLKSKSGKEVTQAFQAIFSEGRKSLKLRSDQGLEFKNKLLQNFLKSEGVSHFCTMGQDKANYAERAIKTIKSRLFRHLTQKNTHSWVDALKSVTSAYNRCYHSSIKMSPAAVDASDVPALWKLQYFDEKTLSRTKPKDYAFEVGETVRLSHIRHVFKRDFDEWWTRELFIITKRRLVQNTPCYWLKDYDNEPITGSFFENELQRVDVAKDTTYKIEKVLRHRKRNGAKEMLVKWLGWPNKFNSWVREDEAQNINHTPEERNHD